MYSLLLARGRDRLETRSRLACLTSACALALLLARGRDRLETALEAMV